MAVIFSKKKELWRVAPPFFFFGFMQQLFFGKSPTGSRFAEKGN